MTFDEQHGWVERGTRGVHSGAVVRDVEGEIAALKDFAMWTSLHIEYDVLDAACQERHDHHLWLLKRTESRGDKRWHAGHAVRLRLAMLTPYVAMMRATAAHREAQQARRALYAGFDVGQGGATAMTTYAVEGDTLRIVHTATIPLPAQTVNVTMTIGGE